MQPQRPSVLRESASFTLSSMHKFECMNVAPYKKGSGSVEQIPFTGVILNDLGREGSRVYRTISTPSCISASRQILRELRMTPKE